MIPANDNARNAIWQLAGMTQGQTLFAVASTIIALLAIIGGLMTIDPPWVARQTRLDSERSTSLNGIHYAVGRYYKENGKLPASLSQLSQTPGVGLYNGTCDPVTSQPYEYIQGAGRDFKLCATFERAAKGSANAQAFWTHEAGHRCFDLTAPSL
jgi:hypothetical protein